MVMYFITTSTKTERFQCNKHIFRSIFHYRAFLVFEEFRFHNCHCRCLFQGHFHISQHPWCHYFILRPEMYIGILQTVDVTVWRSTLNVPYAITADGWFVLNNEPAYWVSPRLLLFTVSGASDSALVVGLFRAYHFKSRHTTLFWAMKPKKTCQYLFSSENFTIIILYSSFSQELARAQNRIYNFQLFHPYTSTSPFIWFFSIINTSRKQLISPIYLKGWLANVFSLF